MSQYHEEVEEMGDDYEMGEAGDETGDEYQERAGRESDSDDEEFGHSSSKVTDTSSAQARKGKDIQGIPWERLSITREKYRQTRLEQYKNYENIPDSGEASEKECKATEKVGTYYEFWQNTRSVKSTILHFQESRKKRLSWRMILIYPGLCICKTQGIIGSF